MQVHQILVHTTHGGIDADVVIVQDNEHVVRRVGHVVQALECQSATHRTIANHGNHLTVSFALFQCSY